MKLSTLRKLNQEQGLTILMVDHKSSLISDIASRIIIMDHGSIVRDGSPNEVFQDVDFLFKIGVFEPQVTEAAWMCKKKGFNIQKLPINMKNGLEIFSKFLPERSVKAQKYNTNQRKLQSISDPVITVENLKFTYPGPVEALKGIDLKIFPGEIVAIIGQNGSGKTTLFKCLNGLLQATEGKVIVAGHDMSQTNVADMAGTIGFLFQNPSHSTT